MTKKELFEIRESNSQQLFNLGNWASVLGDAIPDGTVIGRKTKASKRDIILSIFHSIDKLKENNIKLQQLINETYGSNE